MAITGSLPLDGQVETLSPGTRVILLSGGLTLLFYAGPWILGGVPTCASYLMATAHLHFLYSYLFQGRVILRMSPHRRVLCFAYFSTALWGYFWLIFRVLDWRLGALLSISNFTLHHCKDEIAIRLEANNDYHGHRLGARGWCTAAFYTLGIVQCLLNDHVGALPMLAAGPGNPSRIIAVILLTCMPWLFLVVLPLHLAFPVPVGKPWAVRATALVFTLFVMAPTFGVMRPVPNMILQLGLIGHHGMLWYVHGYRTLVAHEAAPTRPALIGSLERIRTQARPFLISVLILNAAVISLWVLYRKGLLHGGSLFMEYNTMLVWASPHILLSYFPKPPRLPST